MAYENWEARAEIGAVRSELRDEIRSVRLELRDEVGALRRKTLSFQSWLITWVFVALVVAINIGIVLVAKL